LFSVGLTGRRSTRWSIDRAVDHFAIACPKRSDCIENPATVMAAERGPIDARERDRDRALGVPIGRRVTMSR
jgi:hypothetical protein